MNKTASKQSRIFRALSNAGLVMVQPGFPAEQRTLYGLHGDNSDLAIAIKWHDDAGCEWEADFTEQNLMDAHITQNQIALTDSGGGRVCLELFQLKPERL